MSKVWDITTPRDNWERGFARLNYQLTMVRTVFNKRIEVSYE